MVGYIICIINPPLVTARAASCNRPVHLFVSLSVAKMQKNSSKTKEFRAGLYWLPIGSRTWAFQRTHYWTHKIQDGWDLPSWKRHDVILFCWRWSDLDKILQTGAEWLVDCGDMAEIETRSRIPIWCAFGRIQWLVIPEPPATLQGAATWRIHCHDPRATYHIAGFSHLAKSMSWSCHITGCKNSIRHIENYFSPYFILLM